MKVVKLSIQRPIYVTIPFIPLIMLDYLSFRSLSAELMLEFTPPLLSVQIIYPGALPSEVENPLTQKTREVLSSMEGISQTQSYSFEGMFTTMVSFDFGIDTGKVMTEAQNRLTIKHVEPPHEVSVPRISKVSVDERLILIFSVRTDVGSTKLYNLVNKRIVPGLSHIKGVANVDLVGGVGRETQISLNKGHTQEFGITSMMVQSAIRTSSLDLPTGYLQSDEMQMAVRPSGKITSIEELCQIVLRNVSDASIRLEDVAGMVDGVKDPVGMGRIDGQEAILLNIPKQLGASTFRVSEAVGKQIKKLEEQYVPEGLKVEVT